MVLFVDVVAELIVWRGMVNATVLQVNYQKARQIGARDIGCVVRIDKTTPSQINYNRIPKFPSWVQHFRTRTKEASTLNPAMPGRSRPIETFAKAVAQCSGQVRPLLYGT